MNPHDDLRLLMASRAVERPYQRRLRQKVVRFRKPRPWLRALGIALFLAVVGWAVYEYVTFRQWVVRVEGIRR